MSEANTTEGRRSNRKFAPATGIQSDFEKILSLFVESKSVRYEEFAKIWREKKLSLICAGRQSDRETVEFMEECMKVAFKMFMPPYGFQARAGALYLLYGLYNTQPCLPKVKIRVTHADWEHIKTLQTELKKQGHHDTNFILQKMIACGAFHFCAHSDEARGRYTLADDANKAMMDALREDKQRIDELFGEETMDQLERVHRQYHQIKVLLAGPDANRPDRSLDVLHDKFPDMITEALQKHHDNWNEKDSTRKGRGNNSLPTIAEHSEPEDIDTDPDYQPNATLGQRRAELKAVAFRGAKSKQRYKHRKIATESSSDLSSSSPKKKRGRPRGGKPVQPIGRATLSTVPEEGDSTRATGIPLSEDGFLHMPQLEEAEITKPGDKSKNQTDEQSSKSGKKSAHVEHNKNKDKEDEADEGKSEEEDISPKKRKVSKIQSDPAKQRKRGRTKQVTKSKSTEQNDEKKTDMSSASHTKPVKRKAPLKIKDSGKRKKTAMNVLSD